MRWQWGLQSPKCPGTQGSFSSLLWLVVSGSRRAEGGHDSQRKKHIAVLCGKHVHFNCWGTMLLHTTHGLGLWLSGTVCPCTCNMVCLFLLFFSIDFTVSNLTVSLPVLEWHLHVAFIVAFCNLKTMFLSPSCQFGKEIAEEFLMPWATTSGKQLPTLPLQTDQH